MCAAPPPGVESLSKPDVSPRSGGHEDYERVASGRVHGEQVRLADGIILGVDAQKRAPHVQHVAIAGGVAVVILPRAARESRAKGIQ